METEASTVLFTPYYDLLDALKVGQRLGFRMFEIPGDRPHAWPHDLRSHKRQEIRRFLEESKMQIETISIDGSYLLGPGLCIEDSSARNDLFSYIQDLIQLGHDLGCSKFIMLPGRPLITTPPSKARELAVQAMGNSCDFAKNYGIKVCMENTPFATGFFDTPEKMIGMLNDVSVSNLFVRLDPCHCNVSKTVFGDFCIALKGKIESVGLHDNKGDADSHLPIGQGTVNIKSGIECLKEVGYNGSLTIEILPFEGWSIHQAEGFLSDSKKIVDNLLAAQPN